MLEHTLQLSDSCKLQALEFGAPQGKPVVYFHGSPGSAIERQDQARLLEQHKIRLIAINRPGVGDSTLDANKDYSAQALSKRLIQLLDALNIKQASMMGFSVGGLYAATTAYHYPERVDRLILLSSVAPFERQELRSKLNENLQWFYSTALSDPEAVLAALSEFDSAEAIYAYYEGIISEPDKVIFSKADFRATYLQAFTAALKQGLDSVLHDLINTASPWGFDLNELSVQTQQWYGNQDHNIPVEIGHYLDSAIPQCVSVYFENTGHFYSHPQWASIIKAAAD